jgi:hypothetical protein
MHSTYPEWADVGVVVWVVLTSSMLEQGHCQLKIVLVGVVVAYVKVTTAS